MLPKRTANTMSEAIALASPSGKMSKRARQAAEKRLSEALFGPNGLPAMDYEDWALEMCSLLDAIELRLQNDDAGGALNLVRGRFEIAEKHGLDVVFDGLSSGNIH